jgi:t-SNARE complex subunit (syntaxin)
VKFTNKQPQVHEERMAYQQEMQVQEETQQELQKEAVLLEASLQNDLDSVHQVEQSMTQITALLSQFATLVSEQQEEVVAIHDTTLSSKQNVVKGQESLIDAKERTKKSKHYMATLVWAVAMILLFFNWITP